MNLNTGGGRWAVLQDLTICLMMLLLFSLTQLVGSVNINKIGILCLGGFIGVYLVLLSMLFITKGKATHVVGYQGSYFDRMMTKFRWKGNPKAERINRSKLII